MGKIIIDDFIKLHEELKELINNNELELEYQISEINRLIYHHINY